MTNKMIKKNNEPLTANSHHSGFRDSLKHLGDLENSFCVIDLGQETRPSQICKTLCGILK